MTKMNLETNRKREESLRWMKMMLIPMKQKKSKALMTISKLVKMKDKD